jgi:hypothetical protein
MRNTSVPVVDMLYKAEKPTEYQREYTEHGRWTLLWLPVKRSLQFHPRRWSPTLLVASVSYGPSTSPPLSPNTSAITHLSDRCSRFYVYNLPVLQIRIKLKCRVRIRIKVVSWNRIQIQIISWIRIGINSQMLAKIYGKWAYLGTLRFWAFIWKVGSGSRSASKWKVGSGSASTSKRRSGSGSGPASKWYGSSHWNLPKLADGSGGGPVETHAHIYMGKRSCAKNWEIGVKSYMFTSGPGL